MIVYFILIYTKTVAIHSTEFKINRMLKLNKSSVNIRCRTSMQEINKSLFCCHYPPAHSHLIGFPHTALHLHNFEHRFPDLAQLQEVTHCPLASGLHEHRWSGVSDLDITGNNVYCTANRLFESMYHPHESADESGISFLSMLPHTWPA